MTPNSWARRRSTTRDAIQGNRPTQEKFHCLSCGHRAHADVVGATNALRAGLVRRHADQA